MPRTQNAYKKNFLTDVVLRINFPVILEISEGTPNAFQKEIQGNFPILEPIQEIGLKIENNRINPIRQESAKTIWKFRNKEKTEFVELDSGSLAFVVKKYTDYHTFKSKAETIFNTFFKLYPNIIITRMGLRYINQITMGETDYFNWSKYLNNSLIKFTDFHTDKTKIRRLLNISEVALDEDTVLSFKYGILNSTYPSAIVKKEFTLDYDCYTAIQFEKEIFLTKLNEYHDYVKRNFELSIKNAFRAILNHG